MKAIYLCFSLDIWRGKAAHLCRFSADEGQADQGKSCVPVGSVADQGCLSRIPDPNFFHPGSRICIKEFKYFNPKKMVSKL
jgi:hypothetical protein